MLGKEIDQADHRHEHGRDKRYPVVLLLLIEIDGDGPEREDGERLVAPAKPAPDDIETLGVGHLPDEQGDDCREHGDADVETLAHALLVEVDEVGNDESG